MIPPADIPGLPNDITPIIVFLAIGLIAGWLATTVTSVFGSTSSANGT